MRFLTFVALAAFLTFPVLALGDSVDFQGAGTLANGTAFENGSPTLGQTWEVGVRLLEIDNLTNGMIRKGNLGIIDVTTATLLKTNCPAGLCFFGGNLDIDSVSGATIFDAGIFQGSVVSHDGIVTLTAILLDGALTEIRTSQNSFSTQALVHGATVPEPNTLSLMGSGLLGLAGLWWKKKTPAQ